MVVAADGLTSADLIDHADHIAFAIMPEPTDFVKASCDEPWHQVLVNGVSTRVHDINGLPTGRDIYTDIAEFTDYKYD